MISTSWRAQEIRKRLSTRSTTRRAAVVHWQGHPSYQALCDVSVISVQFLMCIKWICEGTYQTDRVFLGQQPFDFWFQRDKKKQKKREELSTEDFSFSTEWLFSCCEDEWMSLCTGCERRLSLHHITFLHTLRPLINFFLFYQHICSCLSLFK